MLGLSTGWAGFGLCPTQTWPNIFEWIKSKPEIDLEFSSDRSVWVISSFGLYWSDSGFVVGAKIWPDLLRFGQYLAGSVKISSNLEGSKLDFNGSWRDLAESGLDLDGLRMRSKYCRVNSVFIRFWNPKLPLDPHLTGSNIGDSLSTTSCSKQVSLDLGGIRSINSNGSLVHLDNHTSCIFHQMNYKIIWV